MTDKVTAFCDRFGLLCHGDTVIVALSGGADSTALLHILYSVKETYSLTLRAAHLHHGIRGAEADRDAAFCKILCENYHIPLDVRFRDIPSIARQRRLGEELCGREERYAFLEELARQHNAKIATAHHADDNAETLLLHLTRGASLRGASGIPPRRGKIIRPLLSCTRAEIEAYCAAHRLDYVTDSTNLADDYSRNRLRHRVMPALRELNPSLEATLLRFTQAAAEACDYLDAQASEVLRAAKTPNGYTAEVLLRQHPAVCKAALSLLIKNHSITAEAKHLDLLTEILRHGGALTLSRDLTAVCQRGFLNVLTNLPDDSPEVRLTDSVSFVYCGKRLTASVDAPINDKSPLLFRTRRDGDTFSFQKRNITKPLGRALREQNIPAALRDSLLCLCKGHTVLWCEALGWSAEGKTYAQTQHLNIELREEMCYDTAQGHRDSPVVGGRN